MRGIVLRFNIIEYNMSVCVVVKLTERPTLRVVLRLYRKNKGWLWANEKSAGVMVKPVKRISEIGWIWWFKMAENPVEIRVKMVLRYGFELFKMAGL